MNAPELPIIELAHGSDRSTAAEIRRACETIGFFYVRGHGVPAQAIEDTLTASQAFFALPTAEKEAIAVTRRNYRGYIPMAAFSANSGDRPPDLYEGYKINLDVASDDPEVMAGNWLYGPNVWPANPPQFAAALSAYWDAVTALAERLLVAFARSLDLPQETFLGHFEKPLSNISLLHYPPWPASDADRRQGIHPHRDTCAFTILLPGAVGGLEVKRRDGTWIDAPPLPDCFIVNIGNMLECWTAGRFKSTPHRVMNLSGKDRYSIAYFALPRYDTIVAPLAQLAPAEGATGFTLIHAGDDLARIIATNWD